MTSGTGRIVLTVLAAALSACAGSRLDRFAGKLEADLGNNEAAVVLQAPGLSPSAPTGPPGEPATTRTPPATGAPTALAATTSAQASPTPAAIPPLRPSELAQSSTPLPVAPLSSQGPWLVGARVNEVLALEADGSGLTRLLRYGYRHPAQDLSSGSSDLHSIVALRDLSCAVTECHYLLHLIQLPELSEVFRIELLNPALAWETGHNPWSETLAANPGLMALDWSGPEPIVLWSPNGRYLAFVGLIDGPSADLYVLDRFKMSITRLTDSPDQPVIMGWSPDSRWVMHMEAEFETGQFGPRYDPIAVWAADVTGGPGRYLYGMVLEVGEKDVMVGWRSDHQFVAYRQPAIGRPSELSLVDLEAERRGILYGGPLASIAMDPQTGIVAFVPGDPSFFPPTGHSGLENPTPTPRPVNPGQVSQGGIYFLRPGRQTPDRLAYEDWYLAFAEMGWVPEVGRFFSSFISTLSFSPDGRYEEISEERELPVASPNGQWLVFVRHYQFPGLAVYATGGARMFSAEHFSVTDVVWRRDSRGFYFSSPESGLWFVATPGFEMTQLRLGSEGLSTGWQLIYP